MKDPAQVLESKEQEIVKVRKEIDALRIVARLLSDDNTTAISEAKPDLHQLIEMP